MTCRLWLVVSALMVPRARMWTRSFWWFGGCGEWVGWWTGDGRWMMNEGYDGFISSSAVCLGFQRVGFGSLYTCFAVCGAVLCCVGSAVSYRKVDVTTYLPLPKCFRFRHHRVSNPRVSEKIYHFFLAFLQWFLLLVRWCSAEDCISALKSWLLFVTASTGF